MTEWGQPPFPSKRGQPSTMNAGIAGVFVSTGDGLGPGVTDMRVSIAVLLLACTSAMAQSPPASQEARNIQLIKQYAELGKRGEHAAQAAFWSGDAVNNGRPMKPEMIGVILTDIYRTFPDYDSEVIEQRAVGDTVVTLSRVSGTHRGIAETNFNGGLLMGAKPTARRFEVLSTHWWRFNESGKIVWHQATRDDLGMMRQLGLIPDKLPADKLAASKKD
jgi:predicted ester cyclase